MFDLLTVKGQKSGGGEERDTRLVGDGPGSDLLWLLER